jgi:hypothetical protein
MKNNNYNYGYLGKEQEAKREIRNFYFTVGSCALVFALITGYNYFDSKKDTRTLDNQTNKLEVLANE